MIRFAKKYNYILMRLIRYYAHVVNIDLNSENVSLQALH